MQLILQIQLLIQEDLVEAELEVIHQLLQQIDQDLLILEVELELVQILLKTTMVVQV